MAWHDEMMQSNAADDCDNDPLWTMIKEGGPEHARGKLAKYCKHLEATVAAGRSRNSRNGIRGSSTREYNCATPRFRPEERGLYSRPGRNVSSGASVSPG